MSFSIAPMHSYATKRVSLVFTILSSAALLAIRLFELNDFSILGFEIQNILLAVLLLSLFGIIGSREKVDDERVALVRGKAFYYAFILQSGSIASFAIIQVLGLIPPQDITAMMLLMIVLFCQAVYLLVFYLSLLFDAGWVYENNTIFEQIRRHHWFYIIWVLISAIMVSIFYFFI